MEPIPVSDIFVIFILGAIVLYSSFIFERMAVFGKIKLILSRKILHIIAIGACTLAAALVQNYKFLALLPIASALAVRTLIQIESKI